MKPSCTCREPAVLFVVGCRILGITGILCVACAHGHSQSSRDDSLRQQLQQLTDAMTRTQAQLEESQHQLQEIRGQLAVLQQQLAESAPAASSSAQLSAAVSEIREQQSLQEAQIATHEQAKVESESKFPVKLNGLVLVNGFVNTSQVDVPSRTTIVLPEKAPPEPHSSKPYWGWMPAAPISSTRAATLTFGWTSPVTCLPPATPGQVLSRVVSCVCVPHTRTSSGNTRMRFP